jgi:hypothetical protein
MGVAQTTGGNIITNNTNTNTMNFASYNSTQMKNDEWGAVAYLSNSAYGTTGAGNAKVYNNGHYSNSVTSNGTCSANNVTTDTSTTATGCRYVTGAGPVANQSDNYGTALYQYHTTIGRQASTTGNIYGIYDTAGGVWEYVMGNFNSTTNTSYMATMPNANYYNNYPSSIFTNNNYYDNNDQCTWATCGGHALHETKTVQSVSSYDQSWGSDYSHFVYSSLPWFLRSGYSYDGSDAGVFASSLSYGLGSGSIGLRVVAGSF